MLKCSQEISDCLINRFRRLCSPLHNRRIRKVIVMFDYEIVGYKVVIYYADSDVEVGQFEFDNEDRMIEFLEPLAISIYSIKIYKTMICHYNAAIG